MASKKLADCSDIEQWFFKKCSRGCSTISTFTVCPLIYCRVVSLTEWDMYFGTGIIFYGDGSGGIKTLMTIPLSILISLLLPGDILSHS